MKMLVALGALLVAAAIAYAAPGLAPVWLTDHLNQLPGKIFCGLVVFLLLMDLVVSAYLHWHVPDNRKALWYVIKVFISLIIFTATAPSGWSIFKKLTFRGGLHQWILDIQMADPSLPWQSVVLIAIFSTCILITTLMLRREVTQPVVVIGHATDEFEWQDSPITRHD